MEGGEELERKRRIRELLAEELTVDSGYGDIGA